MEKLTLAEMVEYLVLDKVLDDDDSGITFDGDLITSTLERENMIERWTNLKDKFISQFSTTQ
jgi:hypothetical protein